MTVEEEIKALGKKARAAAHAMRALDTAAKNAALLAVAGALAELAAAGAEAAVFAPVLVLGFALPSSVRLWGRMTLARLPAFSVPARSVFTTFLRRGAR